MPHPFSRVPRNLGLPLPDRSLSPGERHFSPLHGLPYVIDSNLHVTVVGGPTWIRTRDRPVMSRWLCQLSYGPLSSHYSNNAWRQAEFCLYIGRILLCQGKYPGGFASRFPLFSKLFPCGFGRFSCAPLSSTINKAFELLPPAWMSKFS